MENDIVLKLKKHLSTSINKEEGVVYLLVEIRKILDHEKLKSQFPYLSLFCDWILHIKIDRNNTGIRVIKKIDLEILDESKYNLVYESEGFKMKEIPVVMELINLWGFKKELELFLNKFGLRTSILTGRSWVKFLGLLLNVLIDVPLTFEDQEKLKNISQISIKHNGANFITNYTKDELISGRIFPNWEIAFKDGHYMHGNFGYIFDGIKTEL